MSTAPTDGSLYAVFSEIPDPRHRRGTVYPLAAVIRKTGRLIGVEPRVELGIDGPLPEPVTKVRIGVHEADERLVIGELQLPWMIFSRSSHTLPDSGEPALKPPLSAIQSSPRSRHWSPPFS